MKTEVKTYRYVRQDDGVTSITLPDEKKFYFQTGIRRSIAVIPQWTTWNKEKYGKEEEVWEYKIICVYRSFEAKIESFFFRPSSFEDYFAEHNKSGMRELIQFISRSEEDSYDQRTEEQFIADYNGVLEEHKRILNP